MQLSPTPGDFDRNFEKIVRYTEKGAELGIDVLLFPELTLSGYTLDVGILQSAWGYFQKVKDEVLRLSRKHDVAIVFGIPRVIGGKLRNSVAVFRKKREILFYDKVHLFRREKEIFEPGDDFLVFKFKGVIFGLSICYETAFPEVSRILSLRGASVILSPFAFGRERERIYETATVSRAIENGSYLVASSTFGKGLMDFMGRTRIVHPSGRILVEMSEGEGLVHADYDGKDVERYRYVEEGDSHAYFLNRKPSLYGEICGEVMRHRDPERGDIRRGRRDDQGGGGSR